MWQGRTLSNKAWRCNMEHFVIPIGLFTPIVSSRYLRRPKKYEESRALAPVAPYTRPRD